MLSQSSANDQFYLATSPEVANVSGEYFVSRRKSRANPECYSEAARSKLRSYLEDLTGIKY